MLTSLYEQRPSPYLGKKKKKKRAALKLWLAMGFSRANSEIVGRSRRKPIETK
jgi:hypothetical protein